MDVVHPAGLEVGERRVGGDASGRRRPRSGGADGAKERIER
jgi:hypothetical protein